MRNINQKKKKILIALNKKYKEGEESSGYGFEITDTGKSLTNIQIHNQTGLTVDDVNEICLPLISVGHVKLQSEDKDDKAHRYLITEQGRQAVSDDYYGQLISDKRFARTKDSILAGVALISLLINIFLVLKKYDSATKEKIEILEKRVQQLESKK